MVVRLDLVSLVVLVSIKFGVVGLFRLLSSSSSAGVADDVGLLSSSSSTGVADDIGLLPSCSSARVADGVRSVALSEI